MGELAPLVTLNNGLKCPKFGLGTWWPGYENSEVDQVKETVTYAIDVGYRHIDTAFLYGTEKGVGEAIREKISDGTIKRNDIFLVTKLWNTFHEQENVVPALKRSLENFQLDYVDLYLIHWPVAMKQKGGLNVNYPFRDAEGYEYDYCDTWKGMEECVKLGLAKSIGLSNFNSKQIQRILNNCTIKPVINQIEVSPNLNQKKLIKFCKNLEIHIQAYSPFASPSRPWARPEDGVVPLLNHPKLVEIGKKYGKDASQIILRYLVEIGTIPIPKSSNKERIKANINIFDFNLNKDEIAFINTLHCGKRAIGADEMKNMPNYPFLEEI